MRQRQRIVWWAGLASVFLIAAGVIPGFLAAAFVSANAPRWAVTLAMWSSPVMLALSVFAMYRFKRYRSLFISTYSFGLMFGLMLALQLGWAGNTLFWIVEGVLLFSVIVLP